jgi:hypothetical protein
MMIELRTFEHFPTDKKCIVCGDSDDGRCVLISIDGTGDGHIAEAEPVHLGCAIATNYSRDVGVIYRRTNGI